MAIRMAQPADAAAIAKVHIDSWRTTYQGIVPDDYLASLAYEPRTQWWHTILSQSDPTRFVYIAENDRGQVVGFASGGRERGGDPDYQGELYTIYLLQGAQQRGLGRQLGAAVVQQLLQAGLMSLLVWVLADNPCRRFYEALEGQRLYDKRITIGGVSLVEVAYGWPDARVLLRQP